MKQLRLWMARIFAMLLVFTMGASTQSVNAQDQTLAEGYYYINSTAYTGQGLLFNKDDKTVNRIHAAQHNAGKKVTPSDLPFVFKFTKAEDGIHYTIQNYVNKKYFGRFADAGDDSPGGGLGYVDDPTNFSLTHYDDGYGYTMEYAGDRYPGHGGAVHAQDDGYAGFWGDMSNIYGHKVWNLVPVDEESLKNPVEITEIDGNTEDGYYYINFKDLDDPTTCMVPVNSDQLWRLGAFPREESDFDASFVWHITKNADGETYSIKNCGAQELTYIETVGKGDKESPYVLMTGLNPASFKFKYMSDGSVYIYTTDNDYNFSVSSEGNICTLKAQNTNSAVQFVPVSAANITNALKLTEAITTAQGKQFTVGTNPGQVAQADFDAFKTVLDKAVAAQGSEDDNTTLINELNEATATLTSKVIPIEEGYYTFRNGENDVYLKPYFRDNIWYLGHDEVDPTMDASAVWHVIKNADGNLVLKNCGTQDSTYIKSNASGNNWGFVQMAGTSKTYNIFKNQYSNVFKLYASDNGNFWNADGGNRVSSNNDYHPMDGVWYVEKVEEEFIPYFTKLNEAITDAAGVVKDSKVGPNPGDNLGDATELNNVINEARTMYDEASASDEKVNAMVAKLAEAVKNFNEQDHSMRQIEDGYYYIVSTQDGFQEKGKIAMYLPTTNYLSWRVLRKNNGQYLFNIKNLGDDTYSIQGVESGRYASSNSANGIATTSEQTVPQKFAYSNGVWHISNTVDNADYTLKTYKTETSGVININDGSNIKDWTLVRESNQAVIDSLIEVSASIRVREAMNGALQKAEPAYKAVFRYNSDHNDGLIKETNETSPLDGQIWGTQVNDTYTSYAHLIDGDLNTCFQSSWDSGTWGNKVEEGQGQQWLQVDLRSNPVDNFEFYFGLRNGDWGWKECWSNIDIYATNDANVASQENFNDADWTHVGNYTDLTSYIKPEGANMNSTGRYIYYPVRGLDQQYRYIRFLVRSTIVPQSCMMYTIGEFQVYKSEFDEENSPYNYVEGMKPLVDELKTLIDAAKAKLNDGTEITQEEVDKLTELTKQVDELTPKTDPLDERIAAVREYVEKFADNDEWGDVSSDELITMQDAIDEADSYDHEKPIQSDISSRLEALNKAFAQFKSQQKMPEVNQWYLISNMDQERPGYDQDGDGGTSNSIYDRFCYGNVILAPTTNATKDAYWSEWENAIKWGGYNHAENSREDYIATDPYAMWRLVKMDNVEGEDEPCYAIQSRATGHYIGVYGNQSGTSGMSVEPVPYHITLAKSGALFLTCADKVANSNKVPLHPDGRKILISWSSSVNGPSTWTFEPVGEDIENLEIDVNNNEATIITLPYAYGADGDVSPATNKENGIMTYGIKGVSEDGSKLLLYQKESFAAGEPMIVVAGELTNNADADKETIKMFLPLANDYSYDLVDANGLVGTFNYTFIPNNVGLIKGDSVISTEATEVAVFGQRGYINAAQVKNMEGVETALTLNLKGEFVNNINNAGVATKPGKVNVYTVDGVLVKKNVKAANAKDGLKKGVYIIGKEKVLVK